MGFFGISGGLIQKLSVRLAKPLHAIGSAAAGIAGRGDCAVEESLHRQVESLTIENSRLKALVPENEALKALLGFSESVGDLSVAARVVYEYNDGISRSFVIDCGRNDGLAVGQPVVAGDGVIVGKVSSVRPEAATVMPLADSRSRLAVTVQNSQDTLGVLEGDRGLGVSMRLVPQTETLAVGDTVITSGLEEGIRRGLTVGTIDGVDRVPQEPFQSASVAQFSAWRHPLFVSVLVSGERGGDE